MIAGDYCRGFVVAVLAGIWKNSRMQRRKKGAVLPIWKWGRRWIINLVVQPYLSNKWCTWARFFETNLTRNRQFSHSLEEIFQNLSFCKNTLIATAPVMLISSDFHGSSIFWVRINGVNAYRGNVVFFTILDPRFCPPRCGLQIQSIGKLGPADVVYGCLRFSIVVHIVFYVVFPYCVKLCPLFPQMILLRLSR